MFVLKHIGAVLVALVMMLRFPSDSRSEDGIQASSAVVGFWTLNSDLSDAISKSGVESWARGALGVDRFSALVCELSEAQTISR